MKRFRRLFWLPPGLLALGAVLSCAAPAPSGEPADPLPSWNEGPARARVLDFVAAVSDTGSPLYVPAEERIAVFDNDSTLWAEQPLYFQLAFALDEVKRLAPGHPEWSEQEPFASLLGGDVKEALAGGERALLQIVMATHGGTTSEQFRGRVRDWLHSARHPDTGRRYTEMVYQPMLELLDYLRDNGFKTYIVSGGGIEFIRVFSEEVYGVPPEQVIGSSIKTSYQVADGVPAIRRLPEMDFIDDKAGKPVAINRFIGRRPLMAVGNSDGDFEMLEWTTLGDGARLGMIVHHTDGEREWAYDRKSHIGRLDRGLDQAAERGWTIVDMQADWNTVYPAVAR